MADVFISYAHEDQAFVRRVTSALEAEGFSVWWDHTIPPGRTWSNYIAAGIEEAKACIVVWSEHSVASKWVLEEASIANDAEKLLPVAASNVKPPMGYRSMQAAQLIGWTGDTQNAQWRLLVNEVRRIVGGEVRTAAPTVQPAPAYAPPPAPPTPGLGKKPPWPIIGGVAAVIAVILLALMLGDQPRSADVTALEEPAAAPAEAPADPAAEAAPAAAPEAAPADGAAPTPPRSFDAANARRALAGNNQALLGAFVFEETPQGHAYWYRLSQSSAPLPAAARLQLQDWIAAAGAAPTGPSWRAIAGDWRLTANLRGNTCSAYYRFIDRGSYLQWYTGADASSLAEQTSGGAFSDVGGGRIFYSGYDDQYFQIVGGDLIRTDAQGNRFCTFARAN
ncbi:toll/interleukin-1 receptor domain-containing protein [Terricaulis sp.]|uniref:toll/interleukin-1 receptor domain-containing protein n=1 Tax=Terricaulis sp. TaxID=2768686 RepID=UPI0037846C8F